MRISIDHEDFLYHFPKICCKFLGKQIEKDVVELYPYRNCAELDLRWLCTCLQLRDEEGVAP
jgi:hypothetical protein